MYIIIGANKELLTQAFRLAFFNLIFGEDSTQGRRDEGKD